ncbi:MAG: patatin-like phospholipase family protein [Gammaproteobacteria bacterium]
MLNEPFTLAMSSGFFSFFAHGGMLSVLEEEGIVPQGVAGSSAGALTGGLWSAGLSTTAISELYFSMSKASFWDPAPGPGLLKGERFRQLLREASPIDRIEQCRFPLVISAFDLFRLRIQILSDGPFAESIYASCAVPFLFRPIRIGSAYLIDGGVADRPGLAGVATRERVFYHHIASRSPWRRRNSVALRVPQRDNMVSLIIRQLPRPGPDRMRRGRAAWEAAREATLAALDEPIRESAVEMAGSTMNVENGTPAEESIG